MLKKYSAVNANHQREHYLHQSTAASTWWYGPRPRLRSKWLLAFPRFLVTPGTSLKQTIFSPCCPLNNRRRAARSFSEIDRPFSLFSCLSFARLLIFLLRLMNGKVHPFPVQCALEMRPGRVGRCNAAPAPNGFI